MARVFNWILYLYVSIIDLSGGGGGGGGGCDGGGGEDEVTSVSHERWPSARWAPKFKFPPPVQAGALDCR